MNLIPHRKSIKVSNQKNWHVGFMGCDRLEKQVYFLMSNFPMTGVKMNHINLDSTNFTGKHAMMIAFSDSP